MIAYEVISAQANKKRNIHADNCHFLITSQDAPKPPQSNGGLPVNLEFCTGYLHALLISDHDT